MVEYHVICLDNHATIRPKTDGVTDIEFSIGCRVFYTEETTLYQIMEKVRYMFFVLDREHWNEMIHEIKDPCAQDVPSNNFKSSRVVYDKWDTIPTIY